MKSQGPGMRSPDYVVLTLLLLAFVPLSAWGGAQSWSGPADALPFVMLFVGVVVVLIEGIRVREPVSGTILGLIVGAAMFAPSLLFYFRELEVSAIGIAGFGVLGLATSSMTVWLRRYRSLGAAHTSISPADGILGVSPAMSSASATATTALFRLLLKRALAAAAIVAFCVSAWGATKWYVASNRKVNPSDPFYILAVNDIADETTAGAIMVFAGAAAGVLAAIGVAVLRRKDRGVASTQDGAHGMPDGMQPTPGVGTRDGTEEEPTALKTATVNQESGLGFSRFSWKHRGTAARVGTICAGMVLAFLAYWALAWFCVEWPITDALARPLLGVVRLLGLRLFCAVAATGAFAFALYAFTIILRRRLHVTARLKIAALLAAIVLIPVVAVTGLIGAAYSQNLWDLCWHRPIHDVVTVGVGLDTTIRPEDLTSALEKLRLILAETPGDVSAKDRFGRTPLHLTGSADVARLLIDAGAPLEEADSEGNTPLHEAAFWGHAEVCELLVERGASVWATNNVGQRPISRARVYTQRDSIPVEGWPEHREKQRRRIIALLETRESQTSRQR